MVLIESSDFEDFLYIIGRYKKNKNDFCIFSDFVIYYSFIEDALKYKCDDKIFKELFDMGVKFSFNDESLDFFNDMVFEEKDDLFNCAIRYRDKFFEKKDDIEMLFTTCCIAGNIDYVKKLMPYIDKSYIDDTGYTRLHYAGETGSYDVMNYLLENGFGSQLNVKNKNKTTPIDCAKYEENIEAIDAIEDYIKRTEDLKKISKVINKSDVNRKGFKL